MDNLSRFEAASASDILSWAIDTFGDSFAIATSFQKEGMVILDLASRISSAVRVFTLDTGRLPDETYQHDGNRPAALRHPGGNRVSRTAMRWNSWSRSTDPICSIPACRRASAAATCARCARWSANWKPSRPGPPDCAAISPKPAPPFPRWTATRRAGSRSVPWPIGARLSVEEYIAQHDVPVHPLYARGYTSIGCAPCTRAVQPGESERAGRWWWEEDAKKECGIHFAPDGSVARDIVAEAEPKEMHKGFTLWFTGMSGAGKSTISRLLELKLRQFGARVEVLDGDVVRTHLSKGLGFSKEDRDENIRRIGFVCELLSRNGVIAVAAAISPYRDVRDEVRARIPNFVEVFVECPVEVLAERDVKGLYRRALAGEIPQFTGISDPYEPPLTPEVTVNSSQETPEQSVEKIWATLERLGLVSFDRSPLAH